MFLNKSISLVLPCYNEEVGLEKMLKARPSFIDEVVVIDNASTDHTAEIAQKYQVHLVYEAKRGYGAAYQAGLPKAKGDIIVTMDADCTYPLEDIEKMLAYMIQHNYDFVSGCRFPLKDAFSMPFLSRAGNGMTTWLMKSMFQLKFNDFMTGMWVFRKEVLSSIMSYDMEMAFSLEIKINAWDNPNLHCGEFHIDYHKRVGSSKFNRIEDSMKCVSLLRKIKARKRGAKKNES